MQSRVRCAYPGYVTEGLGESSALKEKNRRQKQKAERRLGFFDHCKPRVRSAYPGYVLFSNLLLSIGPINKLVKYRINIYGGPLNQIK